MDEVRDRFIEHAAMIKSIDPEARIVGPEEWGWSGYLYSGYDLQWGGTHGWGGSLPDRAAHGGMDFLPWFLGQIRQRSEAAGMRLLDLFTVHYYPQGGEFGGGTDTAMQLRRNRSTRSLWDPNYTDETWINDQVRLIPRLKQWVADHYPGTPVGITEYSWGAENHINGATTQADVLGIFGREGLDLATRWVVPAVNLAHVQGVPDVPQLRRNAFDLRRDQRSRHGTQSGSTFGFRGGAFGGRRVDDHGGQQGPDRVHSGGSCDRRGSRLPWHGGGMAAHRSECDRSTARPLRKRWQLYQPVPAQSVTLFVVSERRHSSPLDGWCQRSFGFSRVLARRSGRPEHDRGILLRSQFLGV